MIHARHYVVVASGLAVVLVGASVGGFDGPPRKLFPRLAAWLKLRGITALQVALCEAENLDSSVQDAHVGVQYLCGLGSKAVVLVGYEDGADAIWHAAADESCVRAIALLTPKQAKLDNPQGRSLLVWHEPDRKPALEPSPDVRLIEISKDGLAERADDIFYTLRDWIQQLQESEAKRAA